MTKKLPPITQSGIHRPQTKSQANNLGLKPIRYYIDDHFRAKVTPVPGSVVFCDVGAQSEQSGIYLGSERIAHILVQPMASSEVIAQSPDSFSIRARSSRKIYVGCSADGAVGHDIPKRAAQAQLNQRDLFGLIYKNSHQLPTNCIELMGLENANEQWPQALEQLKKERGVYDLARLKRAARKYLGVTQWRLWDWQASSEMAPEPHWLELNEALERLPMNRRNLNLTQHELDQTQSYIKEITNEPIPESIREKLARFEKTLKDVLAAYKRARPFMRLYLGADLSYEQIEQSNDNFAELAEQIRGNASIKKLAKKMGRDYIAKDQAQIGRVPEVSHSEVHGIHHSDELTRLLPAEAINLDDDTLETLFYARLIEKNLMTYELGGTQIAKKQIEAESPQTGPIVACLDTSGSMTGGPILRAKALMYALASILQKNQRSLYVLLFGSKGQIREYALTSTRQLGGLIHFLSQGYGGGTDFTGPLERASQIISQYGDYKKADVLMLSDGDIKLKSQFRQWVNQDKKQKGYRLYTVLCDGLRQKSRIADETVVL